jgi:molecular chaperone DnaJ
VAVSDFEYYERLGVERGASADEIRKGYRKMARAYHPDVNKASDAEERFKQVQEAYDVLKDDQKRQIYDRFGKAGLRQGPESGFGGFETGDMGDIFDAFFGSRPTRDTRAPQKGRDLQTNVTIDFMDAVHGVEHDVELSRMEVCEVCDGDGAAPNTEVTVCGVCQGSGQVRRAQRSIFGQFVNVSTCENCKGAGKVMRNPCTGCGGGGWQRKKRKLTLTLPAGIDEGNKLRFPGEGEAGQLGGPPGDVYVGVRVRAHKTLKREGAHIYSELTVDVTEAVLGTEAEVETVDGTHQLQIEPGTQPGAVVKLRSRGIPRIRRPDRGDHFVTVNVTVPGCLTGRQRQLFQELGHIHERSSGKKTFKDRMRDVLD